MDTQPAPPIHDDRPRALEHRIGFVERLAALRFQKPGHHQRRALASFLAMHQHAIPPREFVIDQRRRLVKRHDALCQERHLDRLRRLALRHVGQHADNGAVEFLRVLQIADEQARNYLALLPTRRHTRCSLTGERTLRQPRAMNLPRLHIEGRWFVDEHGRRVILRGVNLGGDCKVPYPDGGTNFASDFADHREVSFIGRPLPIAEAEEHLSRLRAWGFNCLRLLTTWEAVEHRGPNDYDTEYLDYFAELCRLAGDYGFYVFVDFHQDVWSRMSGGDGAPGWLFEKVGIDYKRIAESGSAHVMQHLYDYARGGRQEDRYPTMSWSANARRPANGIMWTLFFAGRDFAPGLNIDGVNVQDYMLEHYLGSMREIAQRVRDLPNVMGFDSLNEPAPGWIGQSLTYRHLGPSETNPNRAMPGLAWSPLDGFLVSHGVTRSVPVLDFDPAAKAMVHNRDRTINPDRISIWADDRSDPFEQAGAWKLNKDGTFDVLRDNFFERVGDRKVDFIEDYMGPFFASVAENIRATNPDWILFAELDPMAGFFGPGFPADTPPNTVNAGHWYDIVTLATKTFSPNFSLDAMTGEIATAAEDIQARYERQLGKIARMSEAVNGGAPTRHGLRTSSRST